MIAPTLTDDLRQLSVETFEVEDLSEMDMFAPDVIAPVNDGGGCCSCSCSCGSTCSCSCSSCCACSCSCSSCS